jgi:hypothetical protein
MLPCLQKAKKKIVYLHMDLDLRRARQATIRKQQFAGVWRSTTFWPR